MSDRPRTSWDPGRETEATAEYRRRRARALRRLGRDARRRGYHTRGDKSLREGEYYSPEERAEQQDYQFGRGTIMERDAALRRYELRDEMRRSGTAQFDTEDAAEALAEDKDRKRKRRK